MRKVEGFNSNRFLKVLWNSKFFVLLLLFLFVLIGYFYSYYYVTPMYRSSATVVLVQNEGAKEEITSDLAITRK